MIRFAKKPEEMTSEELYRYNAFYFGLLNLLNDTAGEVLHEILQYSIQKFEQEAFISAKSIGLVEDPRLQANIAEKNIRCTELTEVKKFFDKQKINEKLIIIQKELDKRAQG